MDKQKCPNCGEIISYTTNLIFPADKVQAQCFTCGARSGWFHNTDSAYENLVEQFKEVRK